MLVDLSSFLREWGPRYLVALIAPMALAVIAVILVVLTGGEAYHLAGMPLLDLISRTQAMLNVLVSGIATIHFVLAMGVSEIRRSWRRMWEQEPHTVRGENHGLR